MLRPLRSCVVPVGFIVSLFVTPASLLAQEPVESPPAPQLNPVPSDSVVALARAQIGRRYVLGGERPDEGFDCSGLVRHILSAFDLRLPRTAALQAMIGREVPKDRDKLRPGDILTFGRGSRVTHVGIYVGEGRFVHASTSSRRVVESSLDRSQSSLVRSWRGARRLVASADSAAAPAPTVVSPVAAAPPIMQ
jgi:cell wall-associated NlpC family hydrolase